MDGHGVGWLGPGSFERVRRVRGEEEEEEQVAAKALKAERSLKKAAADSGFMDGLRTED